MALDNIDIAAELGNDLARFSSNELSELASQQVAPEVATNALSALVERDTSLARAAALEILTRPSWDVWLEGYALEALCRLDVNACWHVMEQLLGPAINTVILEAMVLNVESELEVFADGVGRDFALRLADEVRRRDLSAFWHPDEVAAFLARFDSR